MIYRCQTVNGSSSGTTTASFASNIGATITTTGDKGENFCLTVEREMVIYFDFNARLNVSNKKIHFYF